MGVEAGGPRSGRPWRSPAGPISALTPLGNFAGVPGRCHPPRWGSVGGGGGPGRGPGASEGCTGDCPPRRGGEGGRAGRAGRGRSSVAGSERLAPSPAADGRRGLGRGLPRGRRGGGRPATEWPIQEPEPQANLEVPFDSGPPPSPHEPRSSLQGPTPHTRVHRRPPGRRVPCQGPAPGVPRGPGGPRRAGRALIPGGAAPWRARA